MGCRDVRENHNESRTQTNLDKLGSSVVSGVYKIVVVGKCDSVYERI